MSILEEQAVNPEAWVGLYGDLLFGYAYSRTKNRHMAEEVVQETFARGVRRISSFNKDSSVKTWLFGILRNVLRENARNTMSTEVFEEEEGGGIDFASGAGGIGALRSLSPIEAVQRLEFWEVVQSCLAHLPTKTAAVFWEKEVVGASTAAIADAEGITSGNVWVRLHRARGFLQECLAGMLKLGGAKKEKDNNDD
jgi:RNA polymerase sigma-70 factor (ECF subfamily)